MAAPKGNKFALGNKGGRPRKWTPAKRKELLELFHKYIEETEIPVIAEFAYLNWISLQKLYEFDEFRESLKIAITKKQANLEKGGLGNKINTTMAIFSLKQLGWSDNQFPAGLLPTAPGDDNQNQFTLGIVLIKAPQGSNPKDNGWADHPKKINMMKYEDAKYTEVKAKPKKPRKKTASASKKRATKKSNPKRNNPPSGTT